MLQMETVSVSSSENVSSNKSNVEDKNKHSTTVDAVTSAHHKESEGGLSSSWISSIICCIILLIISSVVGYYFYSNPEAAQEVKNKVQNMVNKLPKKV